jgi:hypothetical protein
VVTNISIVANPIAVFTISFSFIVHLHPERYTLHMLDVEGLKLTLRPIQFSYLMPVRILTARELTVMHQLVAPLGG